jgi:hypothetical protein
MAQVASCRNGFAVFRSEDDSKRRPAEEPVSRSNPPGFPGIDMAELRDSWRLRTIAAGWHAVDDWHTAAVDAVASAVLGTGPALSARPELSQACGRLGRSRAEAGIGMAETIEDLAALFAVLDAGDPPLTLVISIAAGWAEEGLARHWQGGCEDPLTGLATVPYLRTRLTEVYREARQLGTSPAATHRLVVVRLSPRPDAMDRVARAISLGHDLRAAFPGGDTLCGESLSAFAAGPAIALVRAHGDLPARYANLRRTIRLSRGAQLRMTPLPALLTEALRLVDELAH